MEDLFRKHYREVRAEPAPDVLQRILQQYQDLQYLPDGEGGGGFLFPDEVCVFSPRNKRQTLTWLQAEKLRPILRQRYGWPDSFREDDWKRDMKEVAYGVRNPEHR